MVAGLIKKSKTKGNKYICRKCGTHYVKDEVASTCEHDYILIKED